MSLRRILRDKRSSLRARIEDSLDSNSRKEIRLNLNVSSKRTNVLADPRRWAVPLRRHERIERNVSLFPKRQWQRWRRTAGSWVTPDCSPARPILRCRTRSPTLSRCRWTRRRRGAPGWKRRRWARSRVPPLSARSSLPCATWCLKDREGTV